MIKLYSAADPLQAHVLRGALEAVGIRAQVRRDTLFGTRGETPVTFDTLPEVWIPADADIELARRVVGELEAPARPASGPMWICPTCRESVEPQFDECWNCGTTHRTGGARTDAGR
jgi:hypothetical protein